MSILIKGALLDGAVTDVYIEKKEIRQVGTDLQVQADQVIDGRRKALIPGFVNAHTHAAMTLFRGFGDDMPLMPWLACIACRCLFRSFQTRIGRKEQA